MYSPQSLGTLIAQRAVCSCSKSEPAEISGSLTLMIPIATIAATPKILLLLMVFSLIEFVCSFTTLILRRAPAYLLATSYLDTPAPPSGGYTGAVRGAFHVTPFQSRTKIAYKTGTSNSVTNVATPRPPICE